MARPTDKIPHVSLTRDPGRKRWRIRFTLEGRRMSLKGGTDRQSTERIAKQLSHRLEQVIRGELPASSVIAYAADRRTLAEHIADWIAELKQDGCTPRHLRAHKQRVTDLLALADVTALNRMKPEPIRKALGRMKNPPGTDAAGKPLRGTSLASLNHYRRAILQFSRWCKVKRRCPDDALADQIPGYNAATDVRHARRILTVDEARRLLTTVRATSYSPGQMPAGDRVILYTLALETGFRASELAALTPESFRLAGQFADTPCIAYEARYTKNRKSGLQPLRLETAATLRAWLTGKPAKVPVFAMPYHPVRMLKPDLERAGIAYKTELGFLDFHSLRHTCGSWLIDQGVNMKVVQVIMRHSTIELTANRYAHVEAERLRQAIGSGPTLDVPSPLTPAESPPP